LSKQAAIGLSVVPNIFDLQKTIIMSMIQMFLKEMDHESETTRNMLKIIPDDKYDWKPHEKSMTIRRLASHLAELPGWITMALHTDGLDFATNPYKAEVVNNNTELMAYYEKSLASGREALSNATDEDLEPKWTLQNGDHIINVYTVGEVIRMAFNQIVHHRAQMGVFLRLLNVPIPGSYGPSADELGL
jgi:uncharacterized damage-inducible protein DinB